jgi:hypothetical protein
MKTQKTFITLGLVLASVIMLPAARANEYDQATKLTFNQSIQIPGRVLPAGTYWFVLADTDNTAITFAAQGAMQPETVLSLFYPGRNDGHEFTYSSTQERELAQAKHHTVVATAQQKPQTAVTGG